MYREKLLTLNSYTIKNVKTKFPSQDGRKRIDWTKKNIKNKKSKNVKKLKSRYIIEINDRAQS